MAPLGVGAAAKAGATSIRAKTEPHKLQWLCLLASSKVHLPQFVSLTCFYAHDLIYDFLKTAVQSP